MAGYKLPHKKQMSMNNLKVFNNPKYIYINKCESNYEINDKIYKGQTISRNQRFNTPNISSISGKIIDIKDGYYVIENDFKETIKKEIKPRDIKKIDKKEYIKILKDNGIVGMGGAGFPTYMKYDTDKKIDLLLVNAVECEPYITADYSIVNEKCTELLESINNILEINNIPKSIVTIKVTNKEIIKKMEECIGKYPKIELKKVRDIYPMGWERTLIKEVTGKVYDKLSIEINTVVNNISTIYAINQSLKYDKPIIERIITVTGENAKNPGNVLVKVGTKITDVIKFMGGKKDNSILVSGGPMMGTYLKDDEIVTPKLNCILILPKPIIDNINNCLRCGKCVNVCPANLAPVIIKDTNDCEELKKLSVNNCIGCGLCSYICPSRIDLRKIVSEKKEVIKK